MSIEATRQLRLQLSPLIDMIELFLIFDTENKIGKWKPRIAEGNSFSFFLRRLVLS